MMTTVCRRNVNVLQTVRELLLGESGRDWDRSWRVEHRPRGPGRLLPSRRQRTYITKMSRGGGGRVCWHDNAKRTS